MFVFASVLFVCWFVVDLLCWMLLLDVLFVLDLLDFALLFSVCLGLDCCVVVCVWVVGWCLLVVFCLLYTCFNCFVGFYLNCGFVC